MKKVLFAAICIVFLSSCGDFMTGMASGMLGAGYYGGGYGYYPDVANQFSGSTINWSSGPVAAATPSVSAPASSGSTTKSSSTSSRRVCVTCQGGGKCNSCGGSGKRTDNYFGTGRSSTVTCGVSISSALTARSRRT